MSQTNPAHPETQLAATLEELLALGTATKRGQKDVSEFLKELKDFVSESSAEIASAYLKEALKQSLSQLAVEVGSKVAGLAIKHFAVILLTIFFEQTDRNLKKLAEMVVSFRTQQWDRQRSPGAPCRLQKPGRPGFTKSFIEDRHYPAE